MFFKGWRAAQFKEVLHLLAAWKSCKYSTAADYNANNFKGGRGHPVLTHPNTLLSTALDLRKNALREAETVHRQRDSQIHIKMCV